MYHFDKTTIPAVIDTTRAAISAADEALRINSQMLMSVVDTIKSSDLPIDVTQDLYGSMVEGINKAFSSRESIRVSLRTMQAIVGASEHSEVMEGCPQGFPWGNLVTQPVKLASVA